MNKKQALEEENERHEKILASIDRIDDRLCNMGFKIYTSVFDSKSVLIKSVDSLEEMHDLLHKARKIFNFKLNSYWVPYKSLVCVEYIDPEGEPSIRFSIDGDENDLIDKISGGKCRVKQTSSLSVVCDL